MPSRSSFAAFQRVFFSVSFSSREEFISWLDDFYGRSSRYAGNCLPPPPPLLGRTGPRPPHPSRIAVFLLINASAQNFLRTRSTGDGFIRNVQQAGKKVSCTRETNQLTTPLLSARGAIDRFPVDNLITGRSVSLPQL